MLEGLLLAGLGLCRAFIAQEQHGFDTVAYAQMGPPGGITGLCCVQLIWTARNCGEVGELTETAEVFISYLPLSHVAAQILDIFIPLMFTVTVYFAQPDALKVRWPECFLRHFVKHHFPLSLFFPTGLPKFILVIPLVSSDSETLISSVLHLSTHYLALAAAALQPLKSVTLSLCLSIPYQSRYLLSSSQDPLLPADLPIHLTPLLLRLRFGFADHCARL